MTAMRYSLAFKTRAMKQTEVINDCLTFSWKILIRIKDNHDKIRQTNSAGNLNEYK